MTKINLRFNTSIVIEIETANIPRVGERIIYSKDGFECLTGVVKRVEWCYYPSEREINIYFDPIFTTNLAL